jgi:hypothetical protein
MVRLRLLASQTYPKQQSFEPAGLIEHRPAAVTRLNRRRNLEIPGTQAGDRRNIADCEIPTRGEQPDERIAERGDSLADLYANSQGRGAIGHQSPFSKARSLAVSVANTARPTSEEPLALL